MPVQAKGAVFCAEEVPTIGGHTGWADMRAAYDALDDGDAGEGRRASPPITRCVTASPSSATTQKEKPTASIAATASTTGRCRCGRW